MQHIARRIVIAPQHQPAVRAWMGTVAQLLRQEFTEERAQLGVDQSSLMIPGIILMLAQTHSPSRNF